MKQKGKKQPSPNNNKATTLEEKVLQWSHIRLACVWLSLFLFWFCALGTLSSF